VQIFGFEQQSDMVTYATAFAQLKITGRIDAKLKEAALNANVESKLPL
jgi:uncharacterized protein YfeS